MPPVGRFTADLENFLRPFFPPIPQDDERKEEEEEEVPPPRLVIRRRRPFPRNRRRSINERVVRSYNMINRARVRALREARRNTRRIVVPRAQSPTLSERERATTLAQISAIERHPEYFTGERYPPSVQGFGSARTRRSQRGLPGEVEITDEGSDISPLPEA